MKLHKGEISLVSSELIFNDIGDQDTSLITLITSLEEFLDIQSNGSADTHFEDVYELFDEDEFEEPQSNTIDGNIIPFLLL